MRILIVEDDLISLRLMHAMLLPLGECSIAFDGKEALAMFREAIVQERQYDLICLDIRLPGMDGLEALKQIRMIEKQLGKVFYDEAKIIMTTGLRDHHNLMNAFENRCDGYLVKPIELPQILDLINRCGLISDTIMHDIYCGFYHGNCS